MEHHFEQEAHGPAAGHADHEVHSIGLLFEHTVSMPFI
jgi:hypothetical protein